MAANPPKPWNIATFEQLRPELTEFVRAHLVGCVRRGAAPHIRQVVAPVKSGKREIVEYLAARDTGGDRLHAFLSSFHRVADEPQRTEMTKFGIAVFTAAGGQAKVAEWLARPGEKVIHIDESDYGTGDRQALAHHWSTVNLDPNVIAIFLYSATPEESIWSPAIAPGAAVRYDPPPTYCGAEFFLQEGLVQEAESFFTQGGAGVVLSGQGLSIVADLRRSIAAARRADPAPPHPLRNVVIVRLTYWDDKSIGIEGKAIYNTVCAVSRMAELGGVAILVDKSAVPGRCKPPPDAKNLYIRAIDWTNPQFDSAMPTLVIIEQKCSRSTEWCFHDRIFAYHEFRPEPAYSAVLQATMRVAHYSTRYGMEFQRIRVYTKRLVLEYAAGLAGLEAVANGGVKFGARIAIARGAAIAAVASRFYPVDPRDPDGFGLAAIIGTIRASPDLPEAVRAHPFMPDAKKIFRKDVTKNLYMGCLRTYSVLSYARVSRERGGLREGPRLTGCYDGEVLGVALRWYDGAPAAPQVTAKTVKSMYLQAAPAPAAAPLTEAEIAAAFAACGIEF
jgi:hypothetical protein